MLGGSPLFGIRIKNPSDIEKDNPATLAHDGPEVVDAVVERKEIAMPRKVTIDMAIHTSRPSST